MVRCKNCGEPIVWAKTEKGKSIPLDPVGERRYVFVSSDSDVARNAETFVAHMATCSALARGKPVEQRKLEIVGSSVEAPDGMDPGFDGDPHWEIREFEPAYAEWADWVS